MNLVEDFRAAQSAVNEYRRTWNALTQEERNERAGGFARLIDALVVAAQALVADAAGRHHIEERSVVYLKLSTAGAWTIDGPAGDEALLGYNDGPLNEACEHDANEYPDIPDLDEECDALRDAAEQAAELPNASQLTRILDQHLSSQ